MTDTLDSLSVVAPEGEAERPLTHFELKADESAADGLRRIVLEQVDLASWHARRVGVADEHVHGVRRVTKRIRAALRMVRDRLGEESYRRDNALLRNVARDLSTVRSMTVRVETLDDLIEGRASLAASTAGLHRQLVAGASSTRVAVLADSRLIESLTDRLLQARVSFDSWTLPPALDPTAAGLRRTYGRGRRGMARALADRSAERFHEWRKQVKYLRHQSEVLTAVRPETMPTITAGLAELGDALGHDHDLADLERFVGATPVGFGSPTAQRELLDAIASRHHELGTDIHQLAEGVYARNPRDFVANMNSYWDEWRSSLPIHAGAQQS